MRNRPYELRVLLRLACVLPILFLTTSLLALQPNQALTQYGLTSWLSGANLAALSITNILQTHDGYLWMATNNGLLRFDGVKFTPFTTANSSLRSNFVSSLWEDGSGTLWIGQEDGGLCRLRSGSISCLGKQDGVPDLKVYSIVGDGAGGFWFAASPSGLGHFHDGRFSLLTTNDGLPNPNVTQLLLARDGALWAGTYDGGAFVYRKGQFRVITKPVLPSNLVWDLAQDRSGAIWLGTFSGLCRLQSEDDTHPAIYRHGQGLPSDDVGRVFVDHNGGIWASSEGGGLSRLEAGRFSTLDSHAGLSDNSVRAITEDREGNLWVGTKSGLTQLHDQNFSTFGEREGLAEDYHRVVLLRRDGNLWAGTYKKGVDVVATGATPVLSVRHIPLPCSPLAAYEDSAKDLWLGCAGGQIEQLRSTHVVEQFSLQGNSRFVEVNALSELTPGRLVAATFGLGLAELRQGRWMGHAFKPEAQHITSLLKGDDGLWVASLDAGLFLVKTNGSVVDFSRQLAGRIPSRLSRDRDGSVWAVTNQGLAHIASNMVRIPLLAGTALEGCTLYSLLDDGRQAYWVTSSRGVFRLPREYLQDMLEGRKPTSRSVLYGFAEGVTAVDNVGYAQPTTALTPDGRLWFATHKGLLSIDSAHLKKNELPPPVQVEQVIADDKPIEKGQDFSWRIPPGRHRIEIQYTALSLTVPTEVRFRYRLENLDTGFIEGRESRSAFYTDLPPGHYRFRVTACNNDGVWNTQGKEISLTQEPHYYQALWFRVLSVLTIAGLGFVLYQKRIQQVRQEGRRIQAAVNGIRQQAAEERAAELGKSVTALQSSVDALSSVGTGPDFIPTVLRILTTAFAADSAAYFEHYADGQIRLRFWLSQGRVFGPQELHSDGSELMNLVEHFAQGCYLPHDYLGGPCREQTSVSVIDHVQGTCLPAFDQLAIAHQLGYELKIPLVVGGQADGAVVAYRNASFTPGEITLGETLGKQLSLGVQLNLSASASLEAIMAREREAAAQERAVELNNMNQSLRESVQAVAASADFDQSLAEVVLRLGALVGAQLGTLFAYDEASNTLCSEFWFAEGVLHREPDPHAPPCMRAPFDADVTPAFRYYVAQHQVMYVNLDEIDETADGQAWPGVLDWHRAHGRQAACAIPILAGQRPLGMIGLAWSEKRTFSPEQLEMLMALSNHAALVMQLRHMERTARIATIIREQERAAEERAAELVQVNANLRENLMRLSDVSSIGTTMERLLESATAQLRAQSACLFLYEKDTDTLRRSYLYDPLASHEVEPLRSHYAETEEVVTSDRSTLWTLLSSSRVPLILDVRSPVDANLLWPSVVRWHEASQQPIVVSALLSLGGQTLGLLGINFGPDRKRESFTTDELQLIESIASLAGMALEMHRLSALARDVAVAEERTKLSEEMHDGIQQIFSAVAFQLAGAFNTAQKSDASMKLRQQIERAAEIAEHGIAEVRRSIQALRDIHPLSGPEFRQSLSALCQSCDSEQIRCLLEFASGLTLSKSRKLNDLLRVAQEAVGNAYKHSGASQVVVRVAQTDSGVELSVTDNGAGFDMSHPKAGGLGLSSMQQRVKRIGGALQVTSGPEGTRIAVSGVLL